MPVWNSAPTLERAVGSIVAQDFEDWELSAVDDGSTDGSAALLVQWAVRDRRIRVCSFPAHAGVVAANDPGLGAVSCKVRLLDPLGQGMQRHVDWANGLLTQRQIFEGRFIESPMVHPSSVIRREWIDRIGGYREMGWPEDYDFWLRLLEAGCRMAKVDQELFHWQDSAERLTRKHPDYASGAVWRMKADFLSRLPGVAERGVALCGAGPIGRRMTGLLQGHSIEVRAIFDVDPAKIGRRVKEVPVYGPEDFGERERDAVLLSAVGVGGGRERVRALASEAGYEEGEDFWCVC